jgi:hypothetical protein
MNFDCYEGGVLMKAPWISAHSQGLAISALVRAWRLTRRPAVMDILLKATRVFERPVEEGGIRVPLPSGALYMEIPGGPLPGIMDGFMTSLLGLYDLWLDTKDPVVHRLFGNGIAGLISTLPDWDYRNKWSWYGCHDYLSPPPYHCLNRLLLEVLSVLSNERCLAEYAKRWDPAALSAFSRLEIFFGCVLTKNGCRLKHRTWRQNPR